MKVSGLMMIKMGKEHSSFQMEIFIKEVLLMAKGMDLVFISMLMEIFMMVNIIIIIFFVFFLGYKLNFY